MTQSQRSFEGPAIAGPVVGDPAIGEPADNGTADAKQTGSRDLVVMAAVVALVALLALPFYVRTMQIEILNGQFWLALCGFGSATTSDQGPTPTR